MNSRLSLLLLFVVPPVLVLFAQHWTPKERVTGVELGRRIYVSEGCIHCHSQYLRPDTLDVPSVEVWRLRRP